jgi:glycosyltransferase involved in cell wall biosynthesis
MRILLIVNPGIPVPPIGYGGIERIVELLAKQYRLLGHEVTVLSSAGSEIDGCKMISIGKAIYPPNKFIIIFALIRIWIYLLFNRNKFDLVHNFGRLLNLFPILSGNVCKIMSYQRAIIPRNSNFILKFKNRNLFFTGCSLKQISNSKLQGDWRCIYNTLDFDEISFVKMHLEIKPLIFLGRLDRIKGCHTAIKIAIKSGIKLIIAGNISSIAEEREYFEFEIKPFIDNKLITYVGEVNNFEKYNLLRNSRALLMPIEWEEPFGIVMIEAMSCGTPVIAFKRGSVDEIIEDGINGYKVNNESEMLESIGKIELINREVCRNYANDRFGIQTIANQYLTIASDSTNK